MGTEGYDFFLAQALEGTGPLSTDQGGSGYFSAPDSALDPRLFEGRHLKPHVRTWILDTLYNYWSRKFERPEKWSRVWLAGSGISYQWRADRSNGDLDVLIGINWTEFWSANPNFQFSEEAVSDYMNSHLRQDVWTHTNQVDFGHEVPGTFEVTFFVNPHSQDIKDIQPYAAYDLLGDSWTVEPPELTQVPHGDVPKEYWDYVNDERRLANSLVERYNSYHGSLKVQSLGSPGWTNAIHAMGLVVDQAHALFDDIHLGRRKAFQPGGTGYADFYNFRWQAHKANGTVKALSSLGEAQKAARDLTQTAEHGKPLGTAQDALTTAMLWNRK